MECRRPADWQRNAVPASLNPERPSAALLRSVREQRAVTQIEGLDDIADPTPTQMARVKAGWPWSPTRAGPVDRTPVL